MEMSNLCSFHLQFTKHFYIFRTHPFDHISRKSLHPNRKSGTISYYSTSAKGAQGMGVHHKLNEERILPHRRAGIEDTDILPDHI